MTDYPATAQERALWRGPIPRGYALVWSAADQLRWELTPEGGKPCRFTVGPGHATCKRPGAARLLRNTRWYAYCEKHLYGRRIRDGRIEGLRLVPTQDAAR